MAVWTTQLEMKVEAAQTGIVEWERKEMKWCEIFGGAKLWRAVKLSSQSQIFMNGF